MSEALPVAEEAEPPSPALCYHCKAELTPESRVVCVACGRRQTRVCFCGEEISRAAKTCPHCGADWSRIRKRPRRSSHERRAALLRYAAIGGGISLATAVLIWFSWQALSSLSAEGAGHALALGRGRLVSLLVRLWQAIRIPLAVFLIGAAGGLAVYSARRSARRSSSRRRRVKRTSRDEV